MPLFFHQVFFLISQTIVCVCVCVFSSYSPNVCVETNRNWNKRNEYQTRSCYYRYAFYRPTKKKQKKNNSFACAKKYSYIIVVIIVFQ